MNRVALVTGASSGIGATTARRLAKAGFTVYAAARRTDRLTELATTAEGDIRALALDVADDASMVAAVERILAETGRIDALVNNAGYGSYGAIEDVPMAEARRQVEVNLFGLARLTQLVLPTMRAQRGGTIVNITSIGGKITTPFGGWYHATKFAVEGLSDALRVEVAPFGVKVVVIEPGGIKTEWGGIAMETAAAASGQGAYADRVAKMAAAMDGPIAQRASDPDVVAKAIQRAVTARRPRTRYAIGFLAKPSVAARKMLSDRAMDFMQSRMLA
jgi:NAD(P)-dependent dehydrogenase (short-subunit alcohol dehydrogenase family)